MTMALTFQRSDPRTGRLNHLRIVDPPDSDEGRVCTAFAAAGYPDVVQGIAVGGCVERLVGGFKRRTTRAHAHNRKRSPYYGWICVRSPERLLTADGVPTDTMWHELAHLLAAGYGHTDKWRAKMRELGQPIPPWLERRVYSTPRCPACNSTIGPVRGDQAWWCTKCGGSVAMERVK